MPWIIMGVFSILLIGSYLYGRIVFKNRSGWRIPKLRQVDLWNGTAAPEPTEVDKSRGWRKYRRRFLEAL